MNYEDNDYLEAVRMCEEYKNQGLSIERGNTQTAKPTNETLTPTEERKRALEEKLANLTPEELAYYRSEIWMQMYDEQSATAEELLDDAQLGKLYRVIRHYLKTGEEPKTNEIEDKLLVSQIKSWKSAIDLIFDYKVKQSLKSKGGGAPKGNQNARKKRIRVSDGAKQTKTT